MTTRGQTLTFRPSKLLSLSGPKQFTDGLRSGEAEQKSDAAVSSPNITKVTVEAQVAV